MREPIRDRERLQHIIEAADTIMEHTKGVYFETFLSDKLLYGALIYYTMVIGEAGYKLSREFTEGYNDTPWSDIAGIRHHIVHGYHSRQSCCMEHYYQRYTGTACSRTEVS